MVEEVEKFRTKLQFRLVLEGERLDYRKVKVAVDGAAQRVASEGAEMPGPWNTGACAAVAIGIQRARDPERGEIQVPVGA